VSNPFIARPFSIAPRPLGIALARQLHRFQLRVALVTAVALLFAQIGAMTHAYSHTADITPASAHQSLPGAHDVCGDCLSFAPLLSAAGTPSALPFIEPQGRSPGIPAQSISRVERSPHLAFRSRAPPVTHGF
jgi:hypothetical protein